MRIPPSVIVMSLLTAVPFGLAVRDHMKDKDRKHHSIDDDEDFSSNDYDKDMREYRESEAQLERVRTEERAQKEEQNIKRTKIASQLLGPEPATLGPFFGGVLIGSNAGDFQPEAVRRKISDASELLGVEWDVDAVQLNGVTVKLLTTDYSDSSCAPLASAVRMWGPKTGEGWENKALHQRATLDEVGCSFTIERYADLEHWLDRTDTSIFPITMVGQSADKLRAKVRDHIEADDESSITWQDIGLSGGTGRQRFAATIENGKVISIEADLPDGMDLAPLVARLDKLTGVKGKDDEAAGGTRWKGKFQALLYNGGVPSLVIGKLP